MNKIKAASAIVIGAALLNTDVNVIKASEMENNITEESSNVELMEVGNSILLSSNNSKNLPIENEKLTQYDATFEGTYDEEDEASDRMSEIKDKWENLGYEDVTGSITKIEDTEGHEVEDGFDIIVDDSNKGISLEDGEALVNQYKDDENVTVILGDPYEVNDGYENGSLVISNSTDYDDVVKQLEEFKEEYESEQTKDDIQKHDTIGTFEEVKDLEKTFIDDSEGANKYFDDMISKSTEDEKYAALVLPATVKNLDPESFNETFYDEEEANKKLDEFLSKYDVTDDKSIETIQEGKIDEFNYINPYRDDYAITYGSFIIIKHGGQFHIWSATKLSDEGVNNFRYNFAKLELPNNSISARDVAGAKYIYGFDTQYDDKNGKLFHFENNDGVYDLIMDAGSVSKIMIGELETKTKYVVKARAHKTVSLETVKVSKAKITHDYSINATGKKQLKKKVVDATISTTRSKTKRVYDHDYKLEMTGYKYGEGGNDTIVNPKTGDNANTNIALSLFGLFTTVLVALKVKLNK